MNYDLAMMALEGLTRSHLRVSATDRQVRIEASASAFKELARLCLILGGQGGEDAGGFELQPGTHVDGAAVTLTLV